MWHAMSELKKQGVTIILTTHYIEEAEEMADRVGVINKGQLVLVEETRELMRKLGKKALTLQLQEPLAALPTSLANYPLELSADRRELVYTYDAKTEHGDIAALLRQLSAEGVDFKDLQTKQSSLEDIFVSLVHEPSSDRPAAGGAKGDTP
jgi:ABC-2 type transport system ATP-binding protein